MEKKRVIPCFLASLLTIFIAVLPAASRSAAPRSAVSQEMIPLGSPVYRDMDILYLVTGGGTPSNARPWSITEAGLVLSRIDRSALDGAGAALHDSIAARIQPGLRFRSPDGFEFGAVLDLNLEAYAHRNTAFDREGDWIHGFEKRRPLAKLSLDFSLKDFFYVYCDLQYGRNKFNAADTLHHFADDPAGVGALIPPYGQGVMVTHSTIYASPFLTNILGHSYDFDFMWPKRAVTALGGANWNLTLARDRLSWGNGHSGNFILDDHVDYHNFARFVAFGDRFKYDWLTVFFETNPSQGEDVDTYFRVLLAHRLEFRILRGLTFAISENVMYKNDFFDIRYLNPAFIYHNLNNRSMFNAIAHAELDYAFARGFNAYAQFVMDQARAPNEGAWQRDAMGYLGGIEYSTQAGPGLLSSSLEYSLTDPLLYRRDGVDFLMYNKYFTHGAAGGPGYVIDLDYMGYPYGGDAQVLQWDSSFRVPGSGILALRVTGMRHGAMRFFTSHNSGGDNAGITDYEGDTPSGDRIEESLVVSLSGEYEVPGLRFTGAASLRAQLDWIGRRTRVISSGNLEDAAMDLQLTVGCSVSL